MRLVGASREAGLAWARRWHREHKPYFDALYGCEPSGDAFCGACGRPLADGVTR